MLADKSTFALIYLVAWQLLKFHLLKKITAAGVRHTLSEHHCTRGTYEGSSTRAAADERK